MRLNIILIACVLAVFPQSTISQDRDELLTEEDIALELSDREGTPALSAPLYEPEYWESYNQWMCFDRDSVELIRVEVESGKQVMILPMIIASLPGYFLEISIHGEGDEENEHTYNRWKQLFEGSRRICAYAAYLNDIEPDGDTPGSTWIINKLKTENGSWTYGEYNEPPRTTAEVEGEIEAIEATDIIGE